MNGQEEDASIWRERLTPDDWGFVTAFPTSETSFHQAYPYSEFVGRFRDWDDYVEQFVSPFERRIVPLETIGVAVARYATVRDFRAMLHKRRAVVLFSHCNEETGDIEFHGEMVPRGDVAAQTPRNFRGIVDLSVCDPCPDIVGMFKARSRACYVAFTQDLLIPRDWVTYYAYFMSRFVGRDASYLSATEDSLRKFRGVKTHRSTRQSRDCGASGGG